MICQVNDGLEGRMIITMGSWMKCRSNITDGNEREKGSAVVPSP
jgi:hypothetical protein